ncbi:hypothetical protein [Rhodopirellula sp. P2]|uniref:hypothetical protein n=1 Tax=Rhodopirellula sp. P2 TaxID=2127060 RepID=UPI00236797FB|nr:hypothetical protein [Rhodopirellula sp. P2]WDQ18404.1 hypothetical protein PSR62_07615 [Rhodopirellula sp. P2]
MNEQRRTFPIAAALLAAAMFGGDAVAQCRSGGGGGPPTGSPASFANSSLYSQNRLASSRYPQGNLIAMQYQQQLLATQRQVASMASENTQRQRFAAMQYEAEVRPYRLARAEAKRAARAERIAARLRAQGRLEDAYSLASVHVDADIPRR